MVYINKEVNPGFKEFWVKFCLEIFLLNLLLNLYVPVWALYFKLFLFMISHHWKLLSILLLFFLSYLPLENLFEWDLTFFGSAFMNVFWVNCFPLLPPAPLFFINHREDFSQHLSSTNFFLIAYLFIQFTLRSLYTETEWAVMWCSED